MHFLLGILAVLGAAAFWWYRVKYISEAAGEAIDAAERVRGAYNRRKFRNKSQGSVLTAIDDPVTAAAAMMVSVASLEGPLSSACEDLIRKHLATVSSDHNVEEEFVFAKWVSENVVDPNNISLKLSGLWTKTLNIDERRELLSMVRQVASVDAEPSTIQLDAIARLADRLGVAS